MNVCSVTVWTVVLISTIKCILGEITTTTSPEPLRYRRQGTLTCNIGKITDTVRWVYNEETRFFCSPPYDAGGCTINNAAVVGDPTYDVNTTAGTISVSLVMKESKNDGLWTCFHGAMSKQINPNPTDYPYIYAAVSIDRARLDVGEKFRITCDVTHTDTQGINVEVRSTRRGSVFTVNNTLDTTFPVALIAKCSDDYDRFECIADGGEVKYIVRSSSIRVKCMKTLIEEETVFVRNVTIGGHVMFSPVMRGSLHQSSSDFDIKWYRLRNQPWPNQMLTVPGYRVKRGTDIFGFGLQITDVHHQDVGQYKLTWNETDSTATNEALFTLQIVDKPVIKKDNCLETDNGANGRFNINRFGMINLFLLTLIYFGRD